MLTDEDIERIATRVAEKIMTTPIATPITVYGDNFNEGSPRMRQLKASREVGPPGDPSA